MTIDLNEIKKRLVKLSKMTVENGCSEFEALNAAQKIAQILDDNGLSYSELKAFEGQNKKPETEHGIFSRGKKQLHEVRFSANAIARFFDCKVFSKSINGEKVINYFGFAADVAAAIALTETLMYAMDNDYKIWSEKNKHNYQNQHGKTLRKAFMVGFTQRVNQRLDDFKIARNAQQTKNALVVLKNQLVEKSFKEEQIRLTNGNVKHYIKSDDAYSAGFAAGDRANLGNPNQIEGN